jgi:subtilase family serine protease
MGVLCATIFSAASALSAQIPDQITHDVDVSHVHPLTNHVPQWANSANSAGLVSSDLMLDQLTMVLSRSPQQRLAFEEFLADQQNPASPDYHRWLTPDEVGRRFGLSANDIGSVTGWLQSQGLHVNWVSPSRTFIGFGGAAAEIGRAFQTELHRYMVHGVERMSIASDPMIPEALLPAIQAIRGFYTLDELPAHRIAGMQSNSPEMTISGGSHFLAPADFATIYNLPASLTGAGVTIGIVSWSHTDFADFDNFRALTGATFANPAEVIPTAFGGVDPGPAYTSPPGSGVYLGGQGEATLDVVRAGSTAPGASLLLVVASSGSANDGIGADAQYLVQTSPVPAQVMSISFGSCEAWAGTAGVTFWDTLFQQAAAEGISVFVSSGDSGASGCDTAFHSPPASPWPNSPNYICSSSYATCVGGTEFNDASNPSTYWRSSNGAGLSSALSYIPEGGWNDSWIGSTSDVASSGGGVSTIIATPGWQIGPGVPAARSGRYTPDVSFSASGHDGYFGCLAAGGGSCVTSGGNYSFVIFSGTSAAAPAMAGVAALLDQKMGAPQGNLNQGLYATAAIFPAAFHDVTVASSGVTNCDIDTPSMCNNSIPGATGLSGGQAGYLVGAGFDEVTGLGSLDVQAFIDNYPTLFTPTVTVTPSAPSITTAQPLSVAIAVSGGAGASTATGSVTLTCGSYTSTAATLSSGGATINVPAGSLATGKDTLTVTYTPDTASFSIYNSASGTNSVTVTVPAKITPTVTVTPSASSITTAQPLTITVAVSGGTGNPMPSGSVTLTSGGYTSAAATLNSGGATINVPAGSLTAGIDSLTVNYTPDATSSTIYNPGSNTASVTVIAPPLTATVEVTPSSASVALTQALTVNVVVSGGNGNPTPTGTVTLTSGAYGTENFAPLNGQYYISEGDSITADVYMPSPSTQAWSAQLSQMPYFKNRATFVNAAVSGSTWESMTTRYPTAVQPYRPNGATILKSYLSILIGRNDLGETPSQIEAGIQAYVNQAKSDGFTVILATTLPSTDAPAPPLTPGGLTANITAFNSNPTTNQTIFTASNTFTAGQHVFLSNIGPDPTLIPPSCPVTLLTGISGGSIVSCANTFTPGQWVYFETGGTGNGWNYLNGQWINILSTGLSSSQFEIPTPSPIGPEVVSGTVSGSTGAGANLNNNVCTIESTGLSSTQFQCATNGGFYSGANTGIASQTPAAGWDGILTSQLATIQTVDEWIRNYPVCGSVQSVACVDYIVDLAQLFDNPGDAGAIDGPAETVDGTHPTIGFATSMAVATENVLTNTFNSVSLRNGSASISIPAGSLALGTDTLTVTYTPDIASATTYNLASATASVTVYAKQAATPVFSPDAGTYTTSQAVTITDSTPGATIYYSTNGTMPTTSSSVYNGPITVSATETLEAIATASGYATSAVATAAYIIKITPTVAITPSSSSITTAQPLTATVAVSGGTGNPAPTGSVTLTSGSYTSAAATLNSGGAAITIPAGSLAVGTYTLTVSYVPDSVGSTVYNSASGTSSAVTVAKAAPTVIVTPSGSNITTAQPLTVTAAVSGGTGNPLPTGSVSLTSGSYSSAAATLNSGTATFNVPAGSLAAGTDALTVTYAPDAASSSTYNSASGSNSVTVTLQIITTPKVTVAPSASSITTAQPLTVTIAVSGGTGSPAPTGSVTLTGSSYSSAATGLLGGSATINVTAGSLAVGSDTLSVAYTPDAASSSTYNSAVGSTSVNVISPIGTLTSTVTVTPSAATITNEQSVNIVVSVAGSTGQATPTGAITLASGSYTAQQTLANGAASFAIAAGTLGSGPNVLTANYAGDGTYNTSSGTATVMVFQAVITVSGPPAPVNPGADTTATAVISASSTYSGTMNLTCALTSSPTGAQSPPTCSLNPASVTIPPGGSGSTVLTVRTTSASTAFLVRPPGRDLWRLGGGGAVLAVVMMFGVPARRRRWLPMLVLLWVIFAAGAMGCGGGGGSNSTTPPPPNTPATTAGAYVFTLAGTDSTNPAIGTSTSVSVTVQ